MMNAESDACETCPFGSAKEGRETLRMIREALSDIRANHSSIVDRVAVAAVSLERIGTTIYGSDGEEGLKVAMVRAKDRLGLLIWIFGIAAVALIGNVLVMLLKG